MSRKQKLNHILFCRLNTRQMPISLNPKNSLHFLQVLGANHMYHLLRANPPCLVVPFNTHCKAGTKATGT